MDRISNADRVVALLRQRLMERAKSANARGATREVPTNNKGGLESLQALAGIDGIDDRHLARALIQNLLVDELGPDLINDARFQQAVDRVVDTLEIEPTAARLLSRLVGDLRGAAR